MSNVTFFRQYTSIVLILIFCLSFHDVNAKEYLIGVEATEYYPLYSFSKSGENPPSFTRELLSAFFEQYQYQYRFIALPVKRFDRWFIEKNIDFKFPDNARWHKETKTRAKITFSDPILTLIAGSYILKSRENTPRDKIKSLITIFGFYPTLWADKIAQKKIKIIEDDSPYSIVKHILYGHADITNIDINVIRHNLKLMNKANEIILDKKIKHEKYHYHLSSIKYPEIIKQFNIFLAHNKPFLKALKIKYGIE